ncbi:DMT family transporter [Kitasatospora sp. NPDC051984]|uniref:DMT family transporter n=1 Tax=Kitasatospora sp. NPDC051984 TaxID=3364059 RepID=UPI0037C91C0E
MIPVKAPNYSIGLPAALAATALWGFTFLGPAAIAPVNIYYLVVGRYAVFGLMSMAVLALNPGKARRMGARSFLKAMHLGVVGYIGFYLLLSLSATIGGGVLASTLTGLIPAMVALASNVFEKALSWRRLLLPTLIVSGGLLLVDRGSAADRAGGSANHILIGIALGFAACLAWAYFVIVNGIILKRAKVPVDNVVWTASIGLGAFCGSTLLIPLARSGSGPSPFADPGTFWPYLGWCAALALLGSWCATWFWSAATKRLPTTIMGPIIGMEAVFGVVFNLLWQHRLPGFYELTGALLVVTGVFLCAYLFNRAAAPPPPVLRAAESP